MPGRRHKCFAMFDRKMAAKGHNTRIACNMFNKNQIIIETELVEERRGDKPKILIALYCPFCGENLKEAMEKSQVKFIT